MEDAIKVYDGLRRALKTLQPVEEGQARNALQQAHVISRNENMQISSAMGTLRAFFRKLEDLEGQHPSS